MVWMSTRKVRKGGMQRPEVCPGLSAAGGEKKSWTKLRRKGQQGFGKSQRAVRTGRSARQVQSPRGGKRSEGRAYC